MLLVRSGSAEVAIAELVGGQTELVSAPRRPRSLKVSGVISMPLMS